MNWAGSVQVIPVNIHVKITATLLYFWLYAINFIIYLLTSKRLRAAYLRFFRDIFQFIGSPTTNLTSTISSTQVWWAAIKNSPVQKQHEQDLTRSRVNQHSEEASAHTNRKEQS